MLGFNAFASISQTTFTNNVLNCIFVFSNNPTFPTIQSEKLIITSSIFKLGSLPRFHTNAAGLSIVFTQTTYTVTVTISNVTTYNNKTDNITFTLDRCSYQCTSVRAHCVNSTGALGNGMTLNFKNSIGAIHCNQRCNAISTFYPNIQISQSWFDSDR